jgi:hypothetical protein
VVPTSGPEYRNQSPSGDQAGSTEYSGTSGATISRSTDTLTSRGSPSMVAGTSIDRPSGAHAGAPRGSSDFDNARSADPSAFIT